MPTAQPPATIAPLSQRPAWAELSEHCKKLSGQQLRQLFAEDSERAERFTIDALGLYFDYSKHRITAETIRLLVELAEQSGLRQHIDADSVRIRGTVNEDAGLAILNCSPCP